MGEATDRRLLVLQGSDQVQELQTIIRDEQTNRSDFKFYADRLIRMVIEEGLNQLPHHECKVITPTGCSYSGLRYGQGNCAVSIGGSGEAMEKALTDCCRGMKIGKILMDNDRDTQDAHVVYARFPDDIADRKVLLLYPIMSSGRKVCKAVEVLKDHSVPEEHIILINLFCTPAAAKLIVEKNPSMTVLTTQLHAVTPNHFGEKYFGSDDVD
jgi:uracil phosphoribosyltransferase